MYSITNFSTVWRNDKTQFSSLIDLLSYRAREQPEQPAYIFLQRGEETSKLSYGDLDRQARAVAAYLQSLDITGMRALLLYPPGLDFIVAFFGCLYAGVVAVPAYPPRRNQNILRLQAIVTDAQAVVALTNTSLLSRIEGSLSKNPELAALDWLVTDSIANNLCQDWQEPKVNSDTLAFLQYTSGSTGMPKGVMISHGNLLHNLSLIHKSFECRPNSRGVIWLPPYHDMGLIGGILQPLYGGFPVMLMSPMDFLQNPLRWLEAISRYKATISGGPNSAYDLCVRKATPKWLSSLDLSSWQVAFNGAEPIRPQTIEQFAATFEPCGFRKEAFFCCYGLAEATLIISGGIKSALPVIKSFKKTELNSNLVVVDTREKDDTQLFASCGQSLPEQKIVIADPKSLTLCPVNQVGEVWVSSPSVAHGYWNKLDETKKIFESYLADTGQGPFLRTGDLGILQDGELFITGRLKDVIIINGQNFYPQDIEKTVENSHESLRVNCGAAFTVEVKGQERLVIVQEVERSYLSKLNLKEVVGCICEAVTAQHDLRIYATVLVRTGTIPKTSSGKIKRHACRSSFISGSLDVVNDWSENPQAKSEFMSLQTKIDLLLQKLSAN